MTDIRFGRPANVGETSGGGQNVVWGERRHPMASEHDARPLEYPCRLCGWEFGTIDGLWAHIPTHTVSLAIYGTLVSAERERGEARAALACSEAARARLVEAARAAIDCLERVLDNERPASLHPHEEVRLAIDVLDRACARVGAAGQGGAGEVG